MASYPINKGVGRSAVLSVLLRWCSYASKKYGENAWLHRRAARRIPSRIGFVCPIKDLIKHES